MPKRPKQYQLEDLSRAKFKLCLPEKWVIRDKDKDYGIDLFDETVNPIFDRIAANEIETRTLTQIRNSLLPKLMTGKIEIQA